VSELRNAHSTSSANDVPRPPPSNHLQARRHGPKTMPSSDDERKGGRSNNVCAAFAGEKSVRRLADLAFWRAASGRLGGWE
jgi:hypothetical protein